MYSLTFFELTTAIHLKTEGKKKRRRKKKEHIIEQMRDIQ